MPAIAAFYAGLTGLLLIVLALRVSARRMRLKVSLGDGGDESLELIAKCFNHLRQRREFGIGRGAAFGVEELKPAIGQGRGAAGRGHGEVLQGPAREPEASAGHPGSAGRFGDGARASDQRSLPGLALFRGGQTPVHPARNRLERSALDRALHPPGGPGPDGRGGRRQPGAIGGRSALRLLPAGRRRGAEAPGPDPIRRL